VFVSHGYYFWVPIVAPLAGGVAGALLFDLAIGRSLPPEVESNPPGRLSQ
jgi:glycerol uptake facilitator protein